MRVIHWNASFIRSRCIALMRFHRLRVLGAAPSGSFSHACGSHMIIWGAKILCSGPISECALCVWKFSVSCGYEPVVLDKLHAIIDISLTWVSILSMWYSRCGLLRWSAGPRSARFVLCRLGAAWCRAARTCATRHVFVCGCVCADGRCCCDTAPPPPQSSNQRPKDRRSGTGGDTDTHLQCAARLAPRTGRS